MLFHFLLKFLMHFFLPLLQLSFLKLRTFIHFINKYFQIMLNSLVFLYFFLLG